MKRGRAIMLGILEADAKNDKSMPQIPDDYWLLRPSLLNFFLSLCLWRFGRCTFTRRLLLTYFNVYWAYKCTFLASRFSEHTVSVNKFIDSEPYFIPHILHFHIFGTYSSHFHPIARLNLHIVHVYFEF